MRWHSTYLKVLHDHCNYALAQALENEPWVSQARLDVGVCSHAVLQQCQGKAEMSWEGISDQVVKSLATNGYTWAGKPQPPLNVGECQEGQRLALRWLRKYGAEPDHASLEVGLAVDDQRRPVDFKEGHVGAVIDCVVREEVATEESEHVELVVADYKSSWQAGEDELGTIQRKIQAVCASAHYPDYDVLRLEVRNLRTLRVETLTMAKDEAEQVLSGWWRDIQLSISVAEEAIKSPTPSPGARCVGCPYLVDCPAARDTRDISAVSTRYAASQAAVDVLRPLVAKNAKSAPVPCSGGHIAYVEKPVEVPTSEAARACWDNWWSGRDITHDEVIGLLEALKLGAGNIQRLGKWIKDNRGESAYDDFMDSAIGKKIQLNLQIVKD